MSYLLSFLNEPVDFAGFFNNPIIIFMIFCCIVVLCLVILFKLGDSGLFLILFVSMAIFALATFSNFTESDETQQISETVQSEELQASLKAVQAQHLQSELADIVMVDTFGSPLVATEEPVRTEETIIDIELVEKPPIINDLCDSVIDAFETIDAGDFLPDIQTVIQEYQDGTRPIDGAGVKALVDISDQHVWLYQGETLIAETDCVTGDARYSPTPTGEFKVWFKRDHWPMRGKQKYYSNHGTFFNKGIAIHDASGWRSEFGGEIYKEAGSMGCVNTPADFAELFWIISTNNTVVVVQE